MCDGVVHSTVPVELAFHSEPQQSSHWRQQAIKRPVFFLFLSLSAATVQYFLHPNHVQQQAEF